MQNNFKKILLIVAGGILLFFGLVGLALPFTPGIFFLVAGAVLLSLVSSRIRRWMEQRTRKHPRMHKFVMKMQEWMLRIIGPTN